MYNPYLRQCPPVTIPYIIQPGDTLYRIALKYRTTIAAIISANPFITPTNLAIGQQICVPLQPVYPPCPEGNYYIVRPGDTLNKIALFYNISLDDLIEANPGINPNVINIGQVICIPVATPPVVCPPPSIRYTIKRGDTFYSIAQMFNISVQQLINANRNINPNTLLIGQSICIPINWAKYENTQYNITLRYPSNWIKVNDERYEGSNGFFQISAANAPSLEEACRNEAFHILKPYGSQPQIIPIETSRRPSCLIIPSADQPPEMNNQAALIVSYPFPVNINGQVYNFFVLWADKNHIRAIAGTLDFLNI